MIDKILEIENNIASDAKHNRSGQYYPISEQSDTGQAGDSLDIRKENSSHNSISSADVARSKQDTLELSQRAKELGKELGKDAKSGIASELSDEEQKAVDELKARDREVRTHEQAHVAAGGGLVTGGPTYSYQQGPDGRQYAIGGEVQIDSAPVDGNPDATIMKMQQVIRAALAPAEPSGQDQSVAAAARAEIGRATVEKSKEFASEDSDSRSKFPPKDDANLTEQRDFNKRAEQYQYQAITKGSIISGFA